MKRALNNKKGAVLKVDKLYIDGTLYEAATEVDSDDVDDTGRQVLRSRVVMKRRGRGMWRVTLSK